jgi:hypothetical protein
MENPAAWPDFFVFESILNGPRIVMIYYDHHD